MVARAVRESKCGGERAALFCLRPSGEREKELGRERDGAPRRGD